MERRSPLRTWLCAYRVRFDITMAERPMEGQPSTRGRKLVAIYQLLGRCAAEFRTRILQHPDRTEFWAYGKQAPGPSRHPSSIVSLRPIATLELSGSSKREQLGVISPRHLRKLHYTIVCLQDDNARLCTTTPYKKIVLWEPLRVADFSRAKRRGRH